MHGNSNFAKDPLTRWQTSNLSLFPLSQLFSQDPYLCLSMRYIWQICDKFHNFTKNATATQNLSTFSHGPPHLHHLSPEYPNVHLRFAEAPHNPSTPIFNGGQPSFPANPRWEAFVFAHLGALGSEFIMVLCS